jgi:hypothetical protein
VKDRVKQRFLEVLKPKRNADDTRDQEDQREIDFFLILLILPFSASFLIGVLAGFCGVPPVSAASSPVLG